jgi:hypothetical protein
VKAYVKLNKNDATDAEAICEPVRRTTMRFVRIKSAEQQGRLMQHRTRDVLISQRTQIINALRASHTRHPFCASSRDALRHYRQSGDVDSDFVEQTAFEQREPSFLSCVGKLLSLFGASILRRVAGEPLIRAELILDQERITPSLERH